MLDHLDKEQLLQMADIHQCRALNRPLNLEETLAQKLMGFDWTYRESDSGSVIRNGSRREEELIAEIDASDLSDDVKMKFLKLFSMSYEAQAQVLAEYSWVRQMGYIDKDPEGGRLGLYYKNVTNSQFQGFLNLAADLNKMGALIKAAGCCDRLLMTDDTIEYGLIREKATAMLKEHKDLFWFGITLPQAAQDMLDDIIRNRKAVFKDMVDTGAAKVLFGSFSVDSNNPGGVWMVSMQTNHDYKQVFGFFFNPQPTRPRRDWKPKNRAEDAGKDFNEKRNILKQRHEDVQEYVERPIGEGQVSSSTAAVKATYTTPALPARVKTPMALSNRPMVVEDKPRVKTQKTAPKKRKPFQVLREVKA